MKKVIMIISLFSFASCSSFYENKYTIAQIFEPIEIKKNEYLLILIEQDIQKPYGPNTLFGFVECSLKVKEESYNDYSDHPPFYITKEINGQNWLKYILENFCRSNKGFKYFLSSMS